METMCKCPGAPIHEPLIRRRNWPPPRNAFGTGLNDFTKVIDVEGIADNPLEAAVGGESDCSAEVNLPPAR